MNIQNIKLPAHELMVLERKVSEILARFPVTSDSARHEFFDLIQSLQNLVNFDLEEMRPISDKMESLFNLADEIYTDCTQVTKNLSDRVQAERVKYRILLAKTLALKHKSFRTYPTGVGLDTKQDVELIKYVLGLLSHYVDFKYPGLILGGELPQIVNTLTGSDPLYLCANKDQIDDFAKLIDNDFYFENRLRVYDYDIFNVEHLDRLPTAQFNIIVALSHIDMQPAFNLQLYLNKIKNLLREGGILIFSFFDNAIPDTMEKIELYVNEQNAKHGTAMTVDPAWWRHMDPYPSCNSLDDYLTYIRAAGLKFVSYNQFINHSVVVCKRYGELKTSKTVQALGEIKIIKQ